MPLCRCAPPSRARLHGRDDLGLVIADVGVLWLKGLLIWTHSHPDLVEPVRQLSSRDAQMYRAITLSSRGVGAMPVSASEEVWVAEDDDEENKEVKKDDKDEDSK